MAAGFSTWVGLQGQYVGPAGITRAGSGSPSSGPRRDRLLDLNATVCYVDDHTVDVDPAIVDQRLERVLLTREELARCEAVVVLTDHDGLDYEMVAEHGHLVLDTCHRCRGQTVEYL